MGFIGKNVRLAKQYLLAKNKRHFIKLMLNKGKGQRDRVGYDSFSGLKVKYNDKLAYIWQFKEIFSDEIYKFKSSRNTPVIIDCGANIGMSALYFLHLYPQAKLYLIEADENVANILEENLHQNGKKCERLERKAAWVHDKGVQFSPDGADGGSIHTNGDSTVASLNFWQYLAEFDLVDFLKIDIEGAENVIFKEYYSGCLSNVQHLFLEYHSTVDEEQMLGEILEKISQEGFRFYLESIPKRKKPFLNKIEQGMDLQVNISCWKP